MQVKSESKVSTKNQVQSFYRSQITQCTQIHFAMVNVACKHPSDASQVTKRPKKDQYKNNSNYLTLPCIVLYMSLIFCRWSLLRAPNTSMIAFSSVPSRDCQTISTVHSSTATSHYSP